MASQEAQEESKKESPRATEYTPSGSNPVVLNESMQSKTAKQGVQQRGNSDNSQTRPATQTVANGNGGARTSDNFYNGSGAKTSIGQQQQPQTSQTAEKTTAP